MVSFERIYHPYYLWEDFKYGFYKSENDFSKEEEIELSRKLFINLKEFERILEQVLKSFRHSLEHNLTNESINKIAYLGQAACAFKYKISNEISRQGYNFLTLEEQQQADKVAEKILIKWERAYSKKLKYDNGQMNLFEEVYNEY